VSSRFYTLMIRSVGEAASIEVDLTQEGLGQIVAAVLEQLDDEDIAVLVANEVGFVAARALAASLTREADERERAAQSRVGTDR